MCTTTLFFFFFFNDTATTEIYTLSLHDALPILEHQRDENAVVHIFVEGLRILAEGRSVSACGGTVRLGCELKHVPVVDRKSTRLNSSHSQISYAVFCLKKKNCTCATCTLSHAPA